MPTHFLALPLAHTPRVASQLANTLPSLWNALPHSVPRKAIRPIGTIHLTLGVLHLENEALVERAKRWLEDEVDVEGLLRRVGEAERARRDKDVSLGDAVPDFAPLAPLIVDLRSLHPLQGQPAHSAAILYLSPHDPTDRLQAFAQSLRDAAVNCGIMRQESNPKRRRVLLHATVVNARYSSAGPRSTRYDFSSVISRFEQAEWATDVPVDGVALCEMGARPTGDGDAVYKVVAWRKLPEWD